MYVAVGNGDRVDSPGLFSDFPMVTGFEEFMLDSYAMPLGGHDVILVVQFLGILSHSFGISPSKLCSCLVHVYFNCLNCVTLVHVLFNCLIIKFHATLGLI